MMTKNDKTTSEQNDASQPGDGLGVYAAINAVQADLAKSGIGKDSTNTYDKYTFRGIDAVYNALAPLLAKHGLCMLPRMVARNVEERVSKSGGALFYVTVEAEFDLVAVSDGSRHVIRTFGEAMDRGDKATNKAMSAAYKYACIQTFAIPTEGDNDADATSHEVQAKPGAKIYRVMLPGKDEPYHVTTELNEALDVLDKLTQKVSASPRLSEEERTEKTKALQEANAALYELAP
jgi:hypothetical protein